MTADGGVLLRAGAVEDAPRVAALHGERISEGFLATLGEGFLRRLYARIARSRRAFLVVAEDAEGVQGFIAVAEDTGRLYREFLLRDGVPAALAAAPRAVRSFRGVWETLRYGVSTDEDLPAAEVLAVAVAGRASGRGIGGDLLGAALGRLRARGIGAARVVTATDNGAALRMYESAGFHRRSQVEVHAGVTQQVLVWP